MFFTTLNNHKLITMLAGQKTNYLEILGLSHNRHFPTTEGGNIFLSAKNIFICKKNKKIFLSVKKTKKNFICKKTREYFYLQKKNKKIFLCKKKIFFPLQKIFFLNWQLQRRQLSPLGNDHQLFSNESPPQPIL